MAVEQLFLLLAGCLALFALLLSVWQLQQIGKLRSEIAELREQKTASKPQPAAPVSFSTSLDAVERQQLQAARPEPPAKSVDKYRYVGSLAEQGLDAKSIAEVLQMPVPEVEQLLQLAKLKQLNPTS